MFILSCSIEEKLPEKTTCVEEAFIYSKDSSVLSNHYVVQEDSETFYFGWDASIFYILDSSVLFIVNKNFAKNIMAIPVNYEYQIEEVSKSFKLLVNNYGFKPKNALYKIYLAYKVSSGQDEFPWTTTLFYELR